MPAHLARHAGQHRHPAPRARPRARCRAPSRGGSSSMRAPSGSIACWRLAAGIGRGAERSRQRAAIAASMRLVEHACRARTARRCAACHVVARRAEAAGRDHRARAIERLAHGVGDRVRPRRRPSCAARSRRRSPASVAREMRGVGVDVKPRSSSSPIVTISTRMDVACAACEPLSSAADRCAGRRWRSGAGRARASTG